MSRRTRRVAGARRRRLLRSWAVAGGVFAAVLAVGAAFIRMASDPIPPTEPRLLSEPTGEAGQRGGRGAGASDATQERVPNGPATADQGEADHEASAAEAAVTYAAAPQRWLYLSDDEVAAEVAAIATADAADDLVAENVAEVAAAREELRLSSGRVWWLVHPLAWRVESATGDRATVAVWTLTLLSAADVAMPQTEWVTTTFDLMRVDGAWRVDATSERPGPTPMTGPQDRPWEPEPFDDALEGFVRLDGEPLT